MLDIVPVDERWNIYEIPGQPNSPTALVGESSGSIAFKRCDITHWESLRDVVLSIGHVDIAVANAGINEDPGFYDDQFDEEGKLKEPNHRVVDVNFRSTINFAKLAVSRFRKQGPGGSLVLTTSCVAYSPEQSLPIYSATKAGVGLAMSAVVTN